MTYSVLVNDVSDHGNLLGLRSIGDDNKDTGLNESGEGLVDSGPRGEGFVDFGHSSLLCC